MNVLLLTQSGCATCVQTKALVERLAAEYPLSLSTLDLGEAEGRELAERAGILFPPGVLLDGEVVGYGRISERKLRREIVNRLKADEFCADAPTAFGRLRRVFGGGAARSRKR